jgi:hypothetical protein
MSILASHRSGDEPRIRKELSPETALRYAWCGWLTMLACPFVLFLGVAWSLMGDQALNRDRPLSDQWFVASVAYMVLIVPATFFIRSRLFRQYWKGECVAPRAYLIGMYTVWGALELGGVLSLAGCLVSRSLLPSLMPAIAAFMMFVVLWPSGRAMICNGRGASDDPEHYEEPR